jgi:hypothetical protein
MLEAIPADRFHLTVRWKSLPICTAALSGFGSFSLRSSGNGESPHLRREYRGPQEADLGRTKTKEPTSISLGACPDVLERWQEEGFHR